MNVKRTMVGVVGSQQATPAQEKLARETGQRIAKEGWILVNGGLGGVMEASAKGAAEAGGVVVGIVPGPTTDEANRHVTIPIATNMGYARNMIIVHTADCLIAVGGETGTLSEIAAGLKLKKLVVGLESWKIPGMTEVRTPEEAIGMIKNGNRN